MTLSSTQLNTSICTLADVTPNFQTQNEINQEIIDAINNISIAFSDHKVALNSTDNTNLTYDYLHAKIDQLTAVSSAEWLPVRSSTISDLTELFYLNAREVPSWTDEHNVFLGVSGGEWQFISIDDTVDNFTVKITVGDSVASYFHDAVNDNATYVGGADIVVASATVGGAATNQRERFFVDSSAISGWDAVESLVLAISGNVVAWVDVGDGGFVTLTEGLAIDITRSGSNWTIAADLTELPGYDAAEYQILGHTPSGAIGWKTLTSKVINNPDANAGAGTTLELNDNGDNLESKLHYTATTISVWPAPTLAAADVYVDTVPITDC